jgi:hypothetical protein
MYQTPKPYALLQATHHMRKFLSGGFRKANNRVGVTFKTNCMISSFFSEMLSIILEGIGTSPSRK